VLTPCALPPGLDANWLRRTYLFGVNLTNDQGKPYPDEIYTQQIQAACELLQGDLGIQIIPQSFVAEPYDVSLTHSPRYQLKLRHRPVREITKWVFRYGQSRVELDPSKIVVRYGPGGEAEAYLRATVPGLWDGYYWFPAYTGFRHGAIQAHIELDYRVGFDRVPAAMADWIGLKASILALDTAGDLIAGAGIASKSIGQDGLSQSIGTTSSATNAGYGARIKSYLDRLPALEATLRAMYRGPRFAGI
jgi:hypothetical protein